MEGRGRVSHGGAPNSLSLAVLHDPSSRKEPPRKPEHSGEGGEADGEVDAGDPAQPPDIDPGRELVDVGPAAARSCSACASAWFRSMPAASSARVASSVSKVDEVIGLPFPLVHGFYRLRGGLASHCPRFRVASDGLTQDPDTVRSIM